MKRQLIALASAGALIAIAACGGGHTSSTPPVQTTAAQRPGTSAAFDWGKSLLDGAAYLGPANVAHMQVNVLVKQQNAEALEQYAQQVSDPSSPVYRHFLTPQEIAARFGATQQDYTRTARYFVQNGLAVAGWPQRMLIAVSGSQSAMERAFQTKLGLYEKDGRQFVAPTVTPSLSAPVPVVAVRNLVAVRTMHAYNIPVPPRANANDALGYSPQQVRNAFDYSGAYAAGYTGAGITVGIIGTGPINVTRPASGPVPCSASADHDLASMEGAYNVTGATVCERDVTSNGVTLGLQDSGIPIVAPGSPSPNVTPAPGPGFPFANAFQTPPPVSQTACTGSLPACNPEDLEAQLDVQQASLLAPGATVDFYLAYNASDCYVYYQQTCNPTGSNAGAPQEGLVEADPEIQQAIGENAADILSLSYGLGEPQQGFPSGTNPNDYLTMEFAELASEGIAVFVASGDNGSAECLDNNQSYLSEVCVSYPAGDKNVTSVGGVNIPVNEFGQLTANITAWGSTNGGASGAGSGGGTSTIFTAPSWQQSAIGATYREQPDVSLLADTYTGVAVYTNGSSCSGCTPGLTGVGGTSVAAPEMAAMWALVLQACKASAVCSTGGPPGHSYRLGNAAPYFYSIYKGSNLEPAARNAPAGFPYLPYGQVFYDVVSGNNQMPSTSTAAPSPTPIPGDPAHPGYDEVTGLGVPYARHLIKAVTNQ